MSKKSNTSSTNSDVQNWLCEGFDRSLTNEEITSVLNVMLKGKLCSGASYNALPDSVKGHFKEA